jgi:hypothetical protein
MAIRIAVTPGSGHPRSTGIVLLVAAILLGSSGQVRAQGEAPLFQDPLQRNGPGLAALAVAGSSSPEAGPWPLFAVLGAGTESNLAGWILEWVMADRTGREATGTATLFLSGFGDARQTLLGRLAVLRAGEVVESWELIDTDKVRPFPKAYLQTGYVEDGKQVPYVKDRKRIHVGTFEAQAYADILKMAHYTSARAFEREARRDLTYAHLFESPEKYRGKVVAFAGRLRLIRRFDPPIEARAKGVGDLFEAWVFDENGSNPYVAVFSVWPAGLDRNLLGKDKVDPPVRVSFAGYFFKRFRYKARDSKANTARDAPLVIGRTLRVEKEPPAKAPPAWSNFLPAFMGLLVLSVVAMAALTWWFRKSDARYRQKLTSVQYQEFVPPAPEPPRNDARRDAGPTHPPVNRLL